jgi:hypothetical protein
MGSGKCRDRNSFGFQKMERRDKDTNYKKLDGKRAKKPKGRKVKEAA